MIELFRWCFTRQNGAIYSKIPLKIKSCRASKLANLHVWSCLNIESSGPAWLVLAVRETLWISCPKDFKIIQIIGRIMLVHSGARHIMFILAHFHSFIKKTTWEFVQVLILCFEKSSGIPWQRYWYHQDFFPADITQGTASHRQRWSWSSSLRSIA